MKKLFLTLLCLTVFGLSYAQSNKEIANVYIKRAWEKYNDIETRVDALDDFNKAIKYLDTITTTDVAKLGTLIHFEVGNWKEAKGFAEQYFNLSKNKKSEEHLNLVEIYVTIDEELEAQIEEEKRIEAERIRKEKELKRIDSLKTIWQNKSKELAIEADSIYNFNSNNFALYNKNGKFGIINDKAEITIEASEYVSAINYAGFILLMNKEMEPTKIYSFNTNNGIGSLIVAPSDFSPLSTHYGKVMLPRANGRLVTYPNNSLQPMIYDLIQKKIVRVANLDEVLKALKKNDRIRKYNNDGEVKIGKEWYDFGGHLGGGIHPLYFEKNYKVHAFLFAVDGKVLNSSTGYDFIGAFYDNKAEAIKGNTTSWVNQNGTKVSEAKDNFSSYSGNSKIVKLEDGSYQILKDGIIINGNKSLEKLPDFLRKFSDK